MSFVKKALESKSVKYDTDYPIFDKGLLGKEVLCPALADGDNGYSLYAENDDSIDDSLAEHINKAYSIHFVAPHLRPKDSGEFQKKFREFVDFVQPSLQTGQDRPKF